MKTTLELPDDLARAMKAQAALEGIKLKDFLEQAIRLRLQYRPGQLSRATPEQVAECQKEIEAWLDEMLALGREIYAESVDSRSLVELIREGRDRC
jgi:hypothetical protein